MQSGRVEMRPWPLRVQLLSDASNDPVLNHCGPDLARPFAQSLYTVQRTKLQVRTVRFATVSMVRKAHTRQQVVQVHEILTTICHKWALLILYQLSHGTKRHGELQRAIPGVSQKMLTQTLRKLARDRLVLRTVYPVVPPRVDYALTPLGETITEPLSALYTWTEEHVKEIVQARRTSQPRRAPDAS